MDDAAGAICGLNAATASGASVETELLLLPLRHGGKTHARMMGALSPVALPAWLGFEPVTRSDIRSMRIIWPSGLQRAPLLAEQRRAAFTVISGGRG